MNRTTWKRWLKSLDGRRRPCSPPARRARLAVTGLESRDVPAAFTPGDLVVYRVGDGSATNGFTAVTTGNLNSNGAPVFLDEYTPAGAFVQSIPMPTTVNGANHRLTVGGSTFGDGLITTTADGRYLLVPGYDAALGTTSITSTTPATVNRVVGRIDSTGAIDTTTALTDATSALRTAASTDGAAIWTSGSTAAATIRLTPFGTSATSVGISSSFTALRGLSVFGNTITTSDSAAGLDGLASVGTGLPVTSGQTTTALPGFPTTGSTPFPSPWQFVYSPDASTLYVADSNTTATNNQGGLQKWVLSGGFWGKAYTINVGASEGLVAVTGDFSGANPVFYAITAESGATVQDKLVKIVDMGSAALSTVTTLVTPPAAVLNGSTVTSSQEYLRGVAFVPTPLGTTADTVGLGTTGSSVPVGTSVTFTATVTAGATGWVTFLDTSTTPATTLGVVPLSGATAQVTTSGLSVGTHAIKAIYGGDSVYVSNSNTITQTITGTNTTTTVVSDTPLPTAANVTVTFTATVAPANAAGTVTFFDNGLPINTSPITPTGGVATVTENTNVIQGTNPLKLTPGSHTITAVFTATAGGGFVSSTSTPLIQNVKPNAFGAGDLLVYRVGDGVSLLTPGGIATGNVVYIDEYTTGIGQTTPVQSIVMPTTATTGGNLALVSAGFQAAEGQVNLSGDGQYAFITGYDTAPGGGVPYTSAASTTPRTIGRIKYDGTIDTSMAVTDLADGGSVRGVASPDGSQIYATGNLGGIRYVSSYHSGLTTSTQIDTGNNAGGTVLSFNDLIIAGNQLYVSDSSTTAPNPTIKVATVGAGVPTTNGQTVTILPGLPDAGTGAPGFPLGYFFTKLQVGPTVGPDTLYIADDGASFFGGAITKWSLANGAWTLNDTIASGGTNANSPIPSFDHLNGSISGGTVNLYATYGNSGNNSGPGALYSIVDTGGYNVAIPSHAINTLASVGVTSNETFRGVTVVPTQATTVANVTVGDGTAERSEVKSISVTFSGPVSFTGGNANAAAAFQLKQLGNTTSTFPTPVAVANLAAAVSTNGLGQTVVMLTFSTTGNTNAQNTGPIDSVSAQNPLNLNPAPLPSLNDGRFQLTILSANVNGPNGPLAGGGPGGNYVSPIDTSGGGAGQIQLYRIFGDATGNGIVDQVDLGAFRTAFNSSGPNAPYVAFLDANNDNNIDQVDLGQFRTRFNSNVFGI